MTGRVLVTGARGFIGAHCLPALMAAGYEVHATTSRQPPDTDGVTWHQADLLDTDTIAPLVGAVAPENLLHLAWNARPGAFWTAPDNVDWLRATLALIEAFAEAGGRRAVGVGTCAEYDWTHGVCSEDTSVCRPATLYGMAKHAAALAWHAVGARSDLSTAWARLFFPYGPGEPAGRFIPSVISALHDKRALDCTSGTQIRDFVYVGDVADSLVALLRSDARGDFNIGSGRPVSLRAVGAAIAEQIGDPALLRFGALPDRPGEPPVLIADTKKMAAATGWRAETSLETGLRATIAASRTP